MAGNHHHHHHQQVSLGDDFFEQILAMPPAYYGSSSSSITHLGVGSTPPTTTATATATAGLSMSMMMPLLGLNLEQQRPFMLPLLNNNNNNNTCSSSTSTNDETESLQQQQQQQHVTGLFPAFAHLQPPSPPPPQPLQPQLNHHQAYYSQPTLTPLVAPPQPSGFRPRVRARRGQATDPHSIAERLRRERIAERMRALQELVPSCNKTDRAAMLDEIVDYVKFLRLQVKVLSMSRVGAAGAVAQLVGDLPLSSVEGGEGVEGDHQPAWEKCSNGGTEQQVAKLMEEDIGAAMQFIQSKSLCIMPISLASTIFRTHQLSDPSLIVKPESNTPP